MLPPVHPDCRASLLPFPTPHPELFVRGRHAQCVILIIGNNCKNRANLLLAQNRLNLVPYPPVHGWANIVKSKQVSSVHFLLLSIAAHVTFFASSTRYGVELPTT